MKSERRITTTLMPAILLLAGAGLTACDQAMAAPDRSDVATAAYSVHGAQRTVPVSGSAVHFFTTAIVHSQQPTETGMVQRSTDIIRLTGDLSGYILYHPTSTFDFAAGTLANTGVQFFAGTILGSDPVVLHDDAFRFDVDLATGATTGEVYLARSNDAPNRGGWYACDLVVVGTGLTPEGDAMVDYSGECTRFGVLN
jgi:hypothetical protein